MSAPAVGRCKSPGQKHKCLSKPVGFRKIPAYSRPGADNYRINRSRCNHSETDECESKVLEEKHSRETLTEDPDKDVTTDINENSEDEESNRREMPKERSYKPSANRFSKEYPEMYAPHEMLAVQRLQKLRELQHRRDLTERFYSNEIRRLIAEYYASPRTDMLALNTNRYLGNSKLPMYSEYSSKNITKALEPCGTMTVITKLDCGCVQETIKPIFTTMMGRVQRKSCNETHDQVLLMPTNPKEHLCSTTEDRKSCLQKSKNRSLMDARNCNPKAGTIAHCARNNLQRRLSETSVASA